MHSFSKLTSIGGVYHTNGNQDDFYIITNVGNQMKDYAIMRVAEKDVGGGRQHWRTVLSPSPGTQIEDVDVFSSHIIWYVSSPPFLSLYFSFS